MAHILLVADDKSVDPVLERTLIAAGHDVDTVSTAEATLDLLRQSYDLVVACNQYIPATAAKSVNKRRKLSLH
jgi:DNA-binding response OmpR family regulator